ncbi:hypothetical protein PHYSODRAFT_265395 [Phytophthora sojae]|uniref:RxLR effector PexRD54 WY domain-containing protein n=1 Tax=Phytophthora sojae (strain P6497) TaxID=1094619 RepID=G4ZV51_PHYSP|nr:hypothetical protein PHYSODRAFT_265395 [Phytophthora sojae]EGZ13675.1 hypothetical protein PHYSODRAFT_265395 [Phytophthora sojae]|eukprot:XP_009531104.1 hypothetical protein PHYSODRAFT_265395 [Phytophthora sojae]
MLTTLLKPTQAQLQKLLINGESADDVFTRMKPNKAGNLLLHDEEFARWLTYADDLKIKHPAIKTSAILTLTAHYGDDGLYKLIEAGLKNEGTETVATKLKTELMKHWVATAKVPDKVFHIMKLDKVETDILSNPEFINWARYVDDFNAKYHKQSTSMVPTVLNYYSDDVIFKMTEAAKSVEETKAIATKLQEELVQAWLKSKKTPDEALVDFGLGKKTRYSKNPVEPLLERALFNSWVKYLDDYNVLYPEKKTTVIEALTRRFGDANVAKMITKAKKEVVTRSLATKLEAAQLEIWLSSGKSVEDVFNLLKLDYAGVFFSEHHLINTLVSYMNVFIKENPSKAATVFSTVETLLEGRPLGQILMLAA